MGSHMKRSSTDDRLARSGIGAAAPEWGGADTTVLADPAAGVLTGYRGARTRHTETGGQSPDDDPDNTAAGLLTRCPGVRTAVGTESAHQADAGGEAERP
ncbi:MAG: hypothetical protein JNM77_02825 [Pseudonocardia sp.]|nr:hypothetical protein [Pseudonocardia sp.]